MKKLVVSILMVSIYSPVLAYSNHDRGKSENQTGETQEYNQSQTGFSQIYPEYRLGAVSDLQEIPVVLGATGLSTKHYVRKSGYRSLKEFIREEVL